MNRITQHIPTFVETDSPPRSAEFTTVEELVAIPWVAHYRDAAFYRWSQSDGLLMVEREGGKDWWVVGRLAHPVEGLPEWDGGRTDLKDADGTTFTVEGKDVRSYCGDVVTMQDGRMFWRTDSPETGVPLRQPPIFSIDSNGQWTEIDR